MDGSDDASNLIELTIQDHAEAHKWLFIEHGREEDAIAWLGLYGAMSKEDVRRHAQYLTTQDPEVRAKKSAAMKGRPKSTAHRAKISAANKGKKKSPEHVAKVAAANSRRIWTAESRARMSAVKKRQVSERVIDSVN